LGYFIDYLRFTIKIDTDIPGIATAYFYKYINLEIEEGQVRKGVDGYKQGIYFPSGIKIMFDGMPGMGIHIIMPGLSLVSPHLECFDIHALINKLKEDETPYNISRVDVAIDTEIDFSYFYNKYIKGQYSCRYDKKHCRQNVDANKRGTLYFGKRGGNTMFRIYDKALEQGIEDKVWTRIELEAKGEVCEQLINSLLDNTTKNIFLGHLRFVNERCENMGKAKTSKKYLEALENPNQPIKLKGKKGGDNTLEWFENQVAPTLKALIKDYGKEYIANIIARSKISKTQQKKRFKLTIVETPTSYKMVNENGQIEHGKKLSKEYIQMCIKDLAI